MIPLPSIAMVDHASFADHANCGDGETFHLTDGLVLIIPSLTPGFTQETMIKCKQFLDYAATHPDTIITCRSSDMVLSVHSDESYLTEPHDEAEPEVTSLCQGICQYRPTSEQ